MNASTFAKTETFLLFTGFIVGVGIATVDNFVSKGEVSPIVIIALLYVATLSSGIVWG